MGIPARFFVGSYAEENEPGILAFVFDPAAGVLSLQGSTSGITNPSFIFVHPNRKWLYAVSETGKGQDGSWGGIHAFRILKENEKILLAPINRQSTNGDWPCHIQLDAGGRWLIVTNYGTGSAGLFPILPNGALGELTSFVQHEGRGPDEARQSGPHAHSSVFSPDNRFVIVADLGIDQLVMYSFDETTGSLSRHAAVRSQPGAGPRHLVFHPDGRYLLCVNELDSSVTAYDYEAGPGRMTALGTLSTLPPEAGENTAADIHFSPSGRYFYVSNRGHNSIAVFGFGSGGGINRLVVRPCGGEWPRSFALAPGGRHILVANRYSNQVSVLPLLAGGADVGGAIMQTEVLGAACVKFLDLPADSRAA